MDTPRSVTATRARSPSRSTSRRGASDASGASRERVRWSFGTGSGVVTADHEGAVTVPDLALGAEPVTLVLTRS